MREQPADFRVEERLGFEPSGSGEHLFLQVRKTGRTTDTVAAALARWLGVRERDVGYAGLKDRHAVTTQWFSVPTAADPVTGPLAEDPSVEVLRVTRNARKLRRGALAGNRFAIRLRHVRGAPGDIAARLLRLARGGVPNYFGAQRFGMQGRNVDDARAMLAGHLRVRSRHRRGLFLSAARSALFNGVLARRVAQGTWASALPGELLMLEGSNSVFPAEREVPDVLARRLEGLDVHPTGPLPGRGGAAPQDTALREERQVLDGDAGLVAALADFGVAGMRRALRTRVGNLSWHWPCGDSLELGFELCAGAYATVVVREALELVGAGTDAA
jgi:tRNA pseudouridine13 synthase